MGGARWVARVVCAAVALAVAVLPAARAGEVPSRRELGDGVWSWFADACGVHFEGVRRLTYVGWVARDGDIAVSAFDYARLWMGSVLEPRERLVTS